VVLNIQGTSHHSNLFPASSPTFGIDGRWRAFTNGRKKALRSNGFIDGDFVEGFLDLDRVARGKVCEGIEGGVEVVQRLIEELTRLH
jgi:hypothetical protein